MTAEISACTEKWRLMALRDRCKGSCDYGGGPPEIKQLSRKSIHAANASIQAKQSSIQAITAPDSTKSDTIVNVLKSLDDARCMEPAEGEFDLSEPRVTEVKPEALFTQVAKHGGL